MRVPVQLLTGLACRVQTAAYTLYVDPAPEQTQLADADWVLLTGTKAAHQQDQALSALLQACPKASIVAPEWLIQRLQAVASPSQRLHAVTNAWMQYLPELKVLAVAAGRHASSQQTGVGFLLAMPAGVLYVAGHTTPDAQLLAALQAAGPVHTAVLTVAERNMFAASDVHGFSVREALTLSHTLNLEQLVVQSPVPGISDNATAPYPEEIRLLHQKMGCRFNLLVNPSSFQLGQAKASVVVRTLNEARYLEELLQGISQQQTDGLNCEVVLVDSGSTDDTVSIAEKYGCRILHITREEFSFGRSLNMGCEAATGDILVITSGHCVPASPHWLQNLCQPLLDGLAQYSYGKQLGGPTSQFSECRVFEKYFPSTSSIPQKGFYCNNANSALLKSAWQRYRFDEELTGLEDMELAQRLVRDGGQVAYVAQAPVYHHHSETWPQVRRRFEREAIALQQIMPNIHVGLLDAVRYTVSSIWGDLLRARQAGLLQQAALDIVRYRYHQFSGSYRGNHEHRKLSHAEKDQYFYPH